MKIITFLFYFFPYQNAFGRGAQSHDALGQDGQEDDDLQDIFSKMPKQEADSRSNNSKHTGQTDNNDNTVASELRTSLEDNSEKRKKKHKRATKEEDIVAESGPDTLEVAQNEDSHVKRRKKSKHAGKDAERIDRTPIAAVESIESTEDTEISHKHKNKKRNKKKHVRGET